MASFFIVTFSINCNYIVFSCNHFVVDRFFLPLYNVCRDKSVHFATERSDLMKKHNYLSVLLVAIFLLLCACARQQTDQTSSTGANALSSIPSSSAPVTSAPATSTPATSIPATSTPATVPTATPTQTYVMYGNEITIPTTDWITDRQIVPFEDRFKEDVPFGYYHPTIWIAPDTRNSYTDYSVFYLWGLSVAMENGMEREFVHNIPIDPNLSAGFSWIAADGRWGYWLSDNELCKIDLLNGNLATLAKKNEGDIRWEVQICGKDTVCIFQLNSKNYLRVYYRDLHSDAEKTLYEGVLPNVPTDEDSLKFYAPTTTQGQVYWETLNPAFYTVYLKELNNPNSALKNSADLYLTVQDHYNIPALIRYCCNFGTGKLTEDLGLYDTCWQTKDCKHNHFDYENTREEVTTVLDAKPVEIPNIRKPTGDLIWDHCDTVDIYMYSEFGYGQPYVSTDYPTFKYADIDVISYEVSAHFVYFVTAEGTIIQISYADRTCETVYTSENKLNELFWCSNYDDVDHLYFVDGNTIVCIDTIAGTCRPIIQTNLDEIFIIGEEYIYYPHSLYFCVRQGMYYKEYRYYPETNEIKEEVFVP